MCRARKASANSMIARITTCCLFTATIVAVHGMRCLRRAMGLRREPRRPGDLRLLVVGTFYNANWFRSHIMPLSQCRAIGRIHVITDAPLFAVSKVDYICPSRRMFRLLGRPLSRAVLVIWAALRYWPDVLMGYHIMPNALLCLVAAALSGGRAVYQMTGGPIQVIGGGFGSENVLLRHLGRPSRVLESLIFHVVREFDLVVVRGRHAVEFVRQHQLADRVEIICGSADISRFRPNGEKKLYDLLLVARHIKEKRPQLFVETIAELHRRGHRVRGALAGEGPLTDALKTQVRDLGLQEDVAFLGKIDHVPEVLAASRIFLLTSETEGLAIAMIEAMAAGLPVLAPRIGELDELLVPDENGCFIEPADVNQTAARIIGLLSDPVRLAQMSAAARHMATERISVAAVATRWNRILGQMFAGGRM